MTDKEMGEALDAIHATALRLARRDDLPEEVRAGLDLILRLSVYKSDVRTRREKKQAEMEKGQAEEGGDK